MQQKEPTADKVVPSTHTASSINFDKLTDTEKRKRLKSGRNQRYCLNQKIKKLAKRVNELQAETLCKEDHDDLMSINTMIYGRDGKLKKGCSFSEPGAGL